MNQLDNIQCEVHHCDEHCSDDEVKILGAETDLLPEYSYFFKKLKSDQPCFIVKNRQDGSTPLIYTSYFVGLDWIIRDKYAVYVAPKWINKECTEKEAELKTDYLKMLFDSLKHTEVAPTITNLFEIKWDEPEITINQQQDLLTPLLVIQFLLLVKEIVRKGLKRSYYQVKRNLHSRIKGKIVVSDTIKHNHLKCKNLDTVCSYEEFGVNGLENRLIKKALVFVQRYLPSYHNFGSATGINDLFNYISPAFFDVSDNIEISELRHTKINAFYKEYSEAIRLSKIILRRFGYNIRNVENQEISTPPFWIDMSKLFELYVLGLLKDRFHNKVIYHYTYRGNELDFLLKSDDYQLVIDAKYRPKYIESHIDEDIRQVSGYARLKKVYEFLEKEYPESIECLIIYPDQKEGHTTLHNVNLTDPGTEIPIYNGIYKLAVKLPVLGG